MGHEVLCREAFWWCLGLLGGDSMSGKQSLARPEAWALMAVAHVDC